MPRVTRKAKHRREGITPAHIEQLLTGHDFFNQAFGRTLFHPSTPAHAYDAMREAWEDLRDELLPAWIAENPGTRPWAWWKFDAPEPRRRIQRVLTPDEQQRVRKHSGDAALEQYSRYLKGSPLNEPERDFLERNGLLTAAEIGNE